MKNILVVCSYNKSKKILIDIIKESGTYNVLDVNSAQECKSVIKNYNIDLIIINAPLLDGYGQDLLFFISENTNSSVIYIIKDIDDNKIKDIENRGIYVMKKPLSKMLLKGIINCYMINRKRYNLIVENNEKLKQRINNIKIINRAKLTLIQYLQMNEAEAHRYIEKQAMDLRITKVEVARNILKIYEY